MADVTKKSGFGARFTWMDTIFLLTVGTLLVWSLSMAIISGTELVFAPFATLLRIFLILAALRVIFLNKFTLIFTGAVIVITLLILAFDALLFTPDPYIEAVQMPIFQEIISFISLTIGYATGFEFYDPAYDAAIQWALNIGLAIFVFVFGFFWFNFFAILSTVLIFGLVLSSGFFFYTTSFYVFIFGIISYLIKHLNTQSIRDGRKNSPFALYALPFTAMCLTLAIAVPTPQAGAAEDFTENFIRQPFVNLNNTLHAAFHPRHFSLSQTGFGMGSTRQLGGNVTANYDMFMRINHPGPIYLTGNVFDRYTGFSWINSFDDEGYILDFSEMTPNLEAFERLSSPLTMWANADFFDFYFDAAEHYEERRRLWDVGIATFGITWQVANPRPLSPRNITDRVMSVSIDEGTLLVEHDFRKFTVFTTGMVTGIVPPEDDINFVRDANGSVQADALMARGARYTIRYGTLSSSISQAEVLNASRQGILRDVYSNLATAEANGFNMDVLQFNHNGVSISYDDLLRYYLIPRSEHISEVYTALPAHFPERVAELAQYVVSQAGAETNLEKAIVLEDFLRNSDNFGYSLMPGATPIYRDFVDFFLFDLRIGYCTYFASAFVTMARSLGLPTRYVEGFIVTGDADSNGYLAVINRQGHAWAEVYFEGFGWHRFDPTPAAAIFAWPDAYQNVFVHDHWDEMMDLMFWDDEAYWHGPFPQELEGVGLGQAPLMIDDATDFNMGLGQIIITSLMITVALTMAILGARALAVVTKGKAISKKCNNEATVAYFHQVLRYMRLFRFEIEEHETAMVFAERVGKRIGFENDKILMTDLADIFARARYCYGEVNAADRQRMEDAVRSLDKRLLGYMGWKKYVLYKYIRRET
ncbi:MAG: transglutaminase domain-containing protein [Defluviitaleaceae bacterium]|nr:transglutaminase domain-containing protein [Defluviitaleaceae bacterium]